MRRRLLTDSTLTLGNRYLHNNQLTSLEVGVFDKNTALTDLYVDAKRKGLGNGTQKVEQFGNACTRCTRKVKTRRDISNEGEATALLTFKQPMCTNTLRRATKRPKG